MKKQYLMGVDVGTQSAKVVIFDLNGNIVCEGNKALRKIAIPAPLMAEHPEDDLWDALKIALNQAMFDFSEIMGEEPNNILAMGLCSIRCCRVLMTETGDLSYPVINWMDKRLNDPYEYQKKYGDVRYVTTTSGYLTHRLTGNFKDTCANYIGWWPMDNDTFDWSTDRDLFKQCNLSREMLFDVVKPGEALGFVTARAAALTGLPEDLPVIASAHDKAVEALGAGSLAPSIALISLGTYIGAMVHGRENRSGMEHFWVFQASIPDHYLYECIGVRRGMWTVSWFCDQFGIGVMEEAHQNNMSVEDLFNREAEKIPPGSEGLITVHDWAPPVEAIYRKGIMFGFDGRHTRWHMYRSILEGIAFTLKNHIDKMADEQGIQLEKLMISGGGSYSDIFMQIFADVFGVPARRNKIKNSASLGSAINAAMAVGCFPSYGDAIKKMVHADDEFKTDINNNRFYNDLNHQIYKSVSQHFDPLLKKLSPLVD